MKSSNTKKVYIYSAAKKYYSSASQHEQKNKKTTSQIKFVVVKIKQQIKLVFNILSMQVNVNVLVQMLLLHSFICSISFVVKKCINYDGACKFFFISGWRDIAEFNVQNGDQDFTDQNLNLLYFP